MFYNLGSGMRIKCKFFLSFQLEVYVYPNKVFLFSKAHWQLPKVFHLQITLYLFFSPYSLKGDSAMELWLSAPLI